MEPNTASSEVRVAVALCCRRLAASAHGEDAVAALRTLRSFLEEGAHGKPAAAQREEFRRSHFTRTLGLLVGHLQADWLRRLSAAQRAELWDGLFLKGPPEQALLVLVQGIGDLGPSENLDHLVDLTERFLQTGRLADLLWFYCQQTSPRDSPQLRETLIGRVVGLPDLIANKLRLNNRTLFSPQQYYPLLGTEMLTALERTCRALKDGMDCSLTFLAQVLGKVCIHGHSGLVLEVMARRWAACTRTDMVWQRVCRKLLEDVPQRCVESVITGLVQAVSGPDVLGSIIGNLVLTNKKTQFVITHKLLLLQYKYETRVLRIILGYLAADRERRPLLVQVLRSLSQAWANPSAVKHTPLEQQLYVSKALLLSVNLLDDSELQQLQSELLQCLLGGMQSHLDSSVVPIRQMGMVVGECLSARMNINGTRLKFEYNLDEETQELRSLMTQCAEDELESDSASVNGTNSVEEVHLRSSSSQGNSPKDEPEQQPDSDLDSDDELTPYDMSGDEKMSAASPPRYLRDCLESLTSSEDSVRVELSLRAAEGLVRRNVFAAREVSVQMTKVLLHMEDKHSIRGFMRLRQAAMVAVAATDCVPVTRYLTAEFYSLNYSLGQRLEVLEVLALAAQELAGPVAHKEAPPPAVTDQSLRGGDDEPAGWRQEVERRIQSKTRRLAKVPAAVRPVAFPRLFPSLPLMSRVPQGATKAPPEATPNRYASVAGHFFFPLLRNYDKPQVTFDLLGSDHLVLGRLIHTLGLLMHLAANAPIAAQMGCSLLEFVWVVRYHVDQMVRRSVLFAVCSVFMSMNSQNLLLDLGEQLWETRTWLADVAEGDPDADCRSLAVQSLVLLDKSLKKQLQDQRSH